MGENPCKARQSAFFSACLALQGGRRGELEPFRLYQLLTVSRPFETILEGAASFMRLAGRAILGLLIIVILVAVGVFLFRAQLTGLVLRQAMVREGLENPQLRVTNVSLNTLRLADVAAGENPSAPQFFFASIEVDYDWRALFNLRRVEHIRLGPGGVRADIDEHGQIRLGGIESVDGDGTPSNAKLPFDVVTLESLDLLITGLNGNVLGNLTGALDIDNGGVFNLQLDTDHFAYRELLFEHAAFKAEIELEKTGSVRAVADYFGDLGASSGALRNVKIEMNVDGAPWRAAMRGEVDALSGEILIGIRSAELISSDSPIISEFVASDSAGMLGAPVSVLSISGEFRAMFERGGLTVFGQEPLRIMADNGAELVLESLDNKPIAVLGDDAGETSFQVKLSGGDVNATGKVSAASVSGGGWQFDMDADINDLTLDTTVLGPSILAAKGTASANMIGAELSLKTTIRRATIGQLTIKDSVIDAPFRLNSVFAEKRVVLDSIADSCVHFAGAELVLQGLSEITVLNKVGLCRSDDPYLTLEWEGAPVAKVGGIISAKSVRYKLGDTTIEGAPPEVDFTALYTPDRRHTTVSGRFAGGRLLINKVLNLSAMTGAFDAALEGDALSGKSRFTAMRISQAGGNQQVEPVVGSGIATLVDDQVQFDFDIVSLEGAPLGNGAGMHDMMTGKGKATYDSGLLIFSPIGFQPSRVISPLYGLARNMSGASSVVAHASWGKTPDEFQSSAVIDLDDVSFQGPGRAVSKTDGLSGNLRFSSLSPLASEGPQTVSLKTVDLDALKLENGEIIFEMPGDETLQLHHGEFPWFGGRIGVYEATASLTGDKVTAPLRAASVDLSQLLEYLKIKSLSGEGVVDGVLPLIIEDGKARIENGELSAAGPGIIRYAGDAVKAAAAVNENARMAFDLLRELHFDKLTAKINGPLDGDLDIRVIFEGANDITLQDQSVVAPIIYRISIEAPLLALIDQARVSTDFHLQYERLKRQDRSGQ